MTRTEGHRQPSALGASERRPGQRGHPNPETRSEHHELLQYKDKQAAEAPRPRSDPKDSLFLPPLSPGNQKKCQNHRKYESSVGRMRREAPGAGEMAGGGRGARLTLLNRAGALGIRQSRGHSDRKPGRSSGAELWSHLREGRCGLLARPSSPQAQGVAPLPTAPSRPLPPPKSTHPHSLTHCPPPGPADFSSTFCSR